MPFLRHPQPRARVRVEAEAVPQAVAVEVEEAGAGEKIAVQMQAAGPSGAALNVKPNDPARVKWDRPGVKLKFNRV